MSPRCATVLLSLAACTPGLTTRRATPAPPDLLEYRWVDTAARRDAHRYVDRNTGQAYTLSDTIALSLHNIDRAEVYIHRLGSTTVYDVIVRLTPDGAVAWAATTGTHVGQRIAVLLDGQIVQTPIVESALGAVAGVVSNVSSATAETLVLRINKAVVNRRNAELKSFVKDKS